FGSWREGRDRIHDDHIDGARPHERVANLKRLLARVGLRNQKILKVNPELSCIDRIERMLGVNEAADAALLLRLGNGVERKGSLTRAFRPVNLDDAAARQA